MLDVEGPSNRPTRIALEYVEGAELGATAIDPSRLRGVLADILSGLEHLHARGLVHGDLKPEHLFVDRAGRGRLLDLGLVLPLGAHPRGGTVKYMAPEYLAGGTASVPGDLYALGAAVTEAVSSLDPQTEALVRACVSASPADRPASALACISALGEIRPKLDVLGGFPRLGQRDVLDLVSRSMIEGEGRAVFVEAARGSGIARLLGDARRRCLERGRSVWSIDVSSDSTWLARGLEVFELAATGDDARDASRVAVRASRAGIAIAMRVEDRASLHLVHAMTVAIDRARAGCLAVVGALEESDASTSGATFVRAPAATIDDAKVMFELAGTRAGAGAIEHAVTSSGGRVGVLGALARATAGGHLSIDDVEREVAAIERPGVATTGAPDTDDASATDVPGPGATESERLAYAQRLEKRGAFQPAHELARALFEASDSSIGVAARAVAAHVALALGDPAEAERLAGEGLARAVSLPERAPMGLLARTRDVVARLHTARSDAALRAGDTSRAFDFARAALAFAKDSGDDGLVAHSLARLAAVHALSGAPEQARIHHELALEHADRSGDVASLPAFIANLATSEHATGRIDRAIEHYQQAAALARRLGRRGFWLAAMTNLAGLWTFVGARVEAARLLDEADETAQAIGDAVYGAQLRMLRAELVRDHDVVAALDLARTAQASFTKAGAERQALEAALLEAEIGVALGSVERSLAFVEQRRAALDEAGLGARSALLVARGHAKNDKALLASRWAKSAADAALALDDRELLARALFEQATALDAMTEGTGAALFDRAREEMSAVAASLPSGMRDRFLEAPERARVMRGRFRSAPAESTAVLSPPARQLLGLVRRVLREGRESSVLEAAIDEAVTLTGAERASLVLARPRGAPEVAVARNMDRTSLRGPRFRFSRSVVERVIRSGETVVTASAPDDPELGKARSVMDLGLRSILCVPIRGPSSTLGAIYVDHRFERGRFAEATVELVGALADIVGVALENARLVAEAERRAADLERSNEAIARENERRAAEVERLVAALEATRDERDETTRAQGGIVGRSHKLRLALDVAKRVAPSHLPVLIRGESGTGKELFARFVHARSGRSAGPFVAVNCGAVPESLLESELFGHKRGSFTGAVTDHAGLFRMADGGTLFLDEIGEMPLRMQTRLLRVLQEGEVRPLGGNANVRVDVRIVAATHRNLEEAVGAGTFREDLFYRLLGARVVLPSLRERREDIAEIAETILARLASQYGRRYELGRGGLDALLRHDWPGNVRELEQTLARAALLCEGGRIDAASLDLYRPPTTRRAEIQAFDRTLLEQALTAAKGNRTLAAKALGVSRVTFHRWMKRYGVGGSES
ncbi:MAG: sigma 54-interacting transcriptional regulator [Polyangiaceae bacterium]|nr:sigma 54-interacting transcriptional regulator [Polyangiaceae bacterium]